MRKKTEIAGLVVMEPVLGDEVAWTWTNMRPEEKQEAVEAGGGEAAHRAAAFKAERSFAIYHGDALLAIATVETMPDGRKFLSMERTVNALAKGHRFAWLRGYGPLGRWIAVQYTDGLWTVTPTDLPRALDVYRHAGAERTGETVKLGGREYWVLRLKGFKVSAFHGLEEG